MTIVAGFSASSQGRAPLHLAAQIARCTGDKVVAAAIVERPWRPEPDPVEQEYLSYVTGQTKRVLDEAVASLPADTDTWVVVSESDSIPQGLTELATEVAADAVVVGSSSTGLLGRVGLGSVSGRLVHTAQVPVAIAPRGYPSDPGPIRRLSVAYGGHAKAVGLIASSAELAQRWAVPLRIVSLTVRPVWGAIERSAEDLVIEQWKKRTTDEISKQLNAVRSSVALAEVDVATGTGHDWRDAVENVPWESGDLFLLGSGAAGAKAQVFLGSAASKILRHTPVPVMILPAR
jgi:nucleotide-binding universal stress UspA family protein